jgi:hypothetical protein
VHAGSDGSMVAIPADVEPSAPSFDPNPDFLLA